LGPAVQRAYDDSKQIEKELRECKETLSKRSSAKDAKMLEKLQEQLKRRLTEKKQQFLQERKKALLVEKKKKQKDWEEKGDASHALVLLPHYVYD